MNKKLIITITILLALLILPSCSTGDPLTDDLYTTGNIYIWDGVVWRPVPDPNYAEMYRHESITVTPIEQANEWHLINGFTAGQVGGGWVFHNGEAVVITAYANNGDGKTLVTSAGHVLVNGDVISIANTANYDGVWIVEQVALNTFVINTAFVVNDGASVGSHGGHFISATATSAGKYLMSYSLSMTPSNPNDIIEIAAFINATQCPKCESQTRLGAATDYQNVAGNSVLVLNTNDVVSIGMRNTSGNGDMTVRNGNVTLVRIG